MSKKKWNIKKTLPDQREKLTIEEILTILMENRGLTTDIERKNFLAPQDPYTFTSEDVGIDPVSLEIAVKRIEQAIAQKESIVVYADYDADGITAGSVLWEAIYALGGQVMPYIPHRVDEGYGLSTIGIDAVKKDFQATLIITVDHGITGWEKVTYARTVGIDVIVTDHHTKPEKLPDTTIVHTTAISGAGVAWFVAKTLLERNSVKRPISKEDLLGLTAIGIIADLLPLQHASRSIVLYGLRYLSQTKRVGLLALMKESGIKKETISMYDISHVLAPRLNAMGRLEHALDALRLLCTTSDEKATSLAALLGETNKERQQITFDTSLHAKDAVLTGDLHNTKKILIIADETYNQGIIGLVAGRLVEEYFLPSIVLSTGETISKASARSIPGFNIVEAIRSASSFLIDVGGHPMAAGFTIETKNIPSFTTFMEEYAATHITPEMLIRSLSIDVELPYELVTTSLYRQIQKLSPFGMGNSEPVFVSRGLKIFDSKLVGAEGKHLKLRLTAGNGGYPIDAIAFGMGSLYGELQKKPEINVAYTIDENEWNGRKTLQLKVKDIAIS